MFAIRWRTYDDANTLDLTETIYRGEVRPFGKTPKSVDKMHLPDDLTVELKAYKLEQQAISPELVLPDAPMIPMLMAGSSTPPTTANGS